MTICRYCCAEIEPEPVATCVNCGQPFHSDCLPPGDWCSECITEDNLGHTMPGDLEDKP